MCTTVLHGGICHNTSTPHKSGNKLQEKKKMRERGNVAGKIIKRQTKTKMGEIHHSYNWNDNGNTQN